MKKTMRIITAAAAVLCLLAGMASGYAAEGQTDAGEETQAVMPRDVSEDLLLVVDFQNVYLPGYDWACPGMPAAMEGKKAVVLAGVVADCCVLATMMDAIDLGYEVVYLYDCIAGVSEESEAEIRGLAEIFTPIHTTVMSKDEYLAAITAG